MKKRRGLSGIIFSVLSGLVLIGIFLAVLSQFGGDLGAFVQWILKSAWNFVVAVKDIVADWATFQRLF